MEKGVYNWGGQWERGLVRIGGISGTSWNPSDLETTRNL